MVVVLLSGYRCRGPWFRRGIVVVVERGVSPMRSGFGGGGSWLRSRDLCGRSLGGGGVGLRGIWDLEFILVRFVEGIVRRKGECLLCGSKRRVWMLLLASDTRM